VEEVVEEEEEQPIIFDLKFFENYVYPGGKKVKVTESKLKLEMKVASVN